MLSQSLRILEENINKQKAIEGINIEAIISIARNYESYLLKLEGQIRYYVNLIEVNKNLQATVERSNNRLRATIILEQQKATKPEMGWLLTGAGAEAYAGAVSGTVSKAIAGAHIGACAVAEAGAGAGAGAGTGAGKTKPTSGPEHRKRTLTPSGQNHSTANHLPGNALVAANTTRTMLKLTAQNRTAPPSARVKRPTKIALSTKQPACGAGTIRTCILATVNQNPQNDKASCQFDLGK